MSDTDSQQVDDQTTTNQDVEEETSLEFKVPSLSTLPKAIAKEITEIKSETVIITETSDENVPNKPEKKILPLPYKEPKWSGISEEEYSFEVLKNGLIINRIDLTKSAYIVFGRLENCDVSLEHPSISRYHAVVQYKASDDDSKGFYIFDLGSTHGTFVNKMKITPQVYVRLKVGYVIKFGGSSRMFILQGPETDEEPESELTITEIKELAKKRVEEETLKAEEKEEESEGVNWGMADDAEEISSENPFALNKTSEELHIEDPKKTLRGWFEREGCELEYKIEELGPGHFSCRIELPISSEDGAPIIAEATLKGKKKDVNIACALEACRILDQHGLLRQAHHEGRQKKRNWEETDFYASDEDTYLDRTGTIEKKRLKRKMTTNKIETETYDTVKEKLTTIEKEIADIERKLAQDKSIQIITTDDNADSLDTFLKSLKSCGTSNVDKATRSKLKLDLAELKKQREQYQNLADRVQPTQLPPLQPVEKKTAKDFKFFIGKRKGGTASKPIRRQVKPSVQPQQEPCNTVEEEEDDDDDDTKPKSTIDILEQAKTQDQLKNKVEILPPKEVKALSPISAEIPLLAENKIKEQTIKQSSTDDTIKQKQGSIEQQKAIELPSKIDQDEGKRKESPSLEEQQGKKKSKRQRQNKKNVELGATYDSSDPNYVLWLPPDDQKGDGRSHLNTKFGY